jgi:hypothetical protein
MIIEGRAAATISNVIKNLSSKLNSKSLKALSNCSNKKLLIIL